MGNGQNRGEEKIRTRAESSKRRGGMTFVGRFGKVIEKQKKGVLKSSEKNVKE